MDKKEKYLLSRAESYLEKYNDWKAYMEVNDKEIEDCESRLASLAGSPKSPVYSFAPKGGNINGGQPENECVEKERLIEKIKRLEQINHNIWLKICRIDRAISFLEKVDQAIIRGRWIDKFTWEELSRKVDGSPTFCRKHHDKALQQVANIMFGPADVV